ncbi:hypothetical protein EG68_10973 [Paragonimus skrjabini miyazakii]|uniref:Uncharacterized protein n=1 Tax=Paragonimus skrjabini miyazakii TaxID=59628 RepID=A0A8S9YFD8_9TREM|nr:hypothetical protein EG68_10973 [Paragonimus skrjabini miyazakii]
MARFHPKLVGSQPWYLPGSSQPSWATSSPFTEYPGSLSDLPVHQNQLLLPAYLASSYSSMHMANLQQNNAMPLLSYGRHGGNCFDPSKALAFVHPMPQALLGPPLPHTQPPGCEIPASYFPQSHRPHPYSWIKRSSSALSQRHPSSTGRIGTESISAHANNHSNTDNEFRGFRNEKSASDKRTSRSSSADSNSHPSLASSLNNTVASDLWQNEACITSCTLPAHADFKGAPVECVDSIESSVLKSGCIEVDDSISETTSHQESNNGKRSKLVSGGDLDCPTGDHHPPVSSHLGPACSPASLRSQARLFYPHVPLTPFTVGFPTQQSSCSSTRSDGATSGEILDSQTSAACRDDRGANKSPHQPPSQQSQQPQTVPSFQHLPVDRNQQPHAVAANQLTSPLLVQAGRGLRILPNGPLVSPGVPLPFPQTNSAMPLATTSLPPSTCLIPSSLYMDTLTLTIWQFYTSTRQSKVKYAKKVHLRNALHMVVSGVFESMLFSGCLLDG